MNLTGQNILGYETSKQGISTFQSYNPSTSTVLPDIFYEATTEEVNTACKKAELAFDIYRKISTSERALFLETIADEIIDLGDALLDRCHLESGLPIKRFQGERGRTVNQLRMFADLLKEGSWVDARIDTKNADIRQMQVPLGAVGIFGASNFPLAFSVAGGDTASALAAGCSIVVKGHPAHPGVSEMVGKAIQTAAQKTRMPDGVFSLVQGQSIEVGQAIVRHPYIKAIGFTGSLKGGKAIFDEANRRPEPIPVYAEMGSTNPVFILPNMLKEKGGELAKSLRKSVTMGVGQFCTNPGLTILPDTTERIGFINMAKEAFETSYSATMLTEGIKNNYNTELGKLQEQHGVEVLAKGGENEEGEQGIPHLLQTDIAHFLENEVMENEVFGPSTLLINASSKAEILQFARQLHGHLTATVHGTEEDLKEYEDLIEILHRKAGRLLINGFPTGVEVCHAMVHGGPFPATTDARMTSVGTGAITRFTRPLCFQNFPQFLLPKELKDENPLNIWRLENGEWKR
ncbi:MAG: aldehyde dehydrogenase (NADP(+)) [Bacteroidota bacterium]